MVTMNSAEQVLKTVYLDVVANQLNTEINPLLSRIKQSTEDVWGKEVRKLAPFGINGGIGAGTEEGDLPKAYGNNYVQYVSALKNLYGQISISDKAMRASENNTGAFVNLLNAEMEGLIKASAFNFGRMLFGDGTGVIAKVESAAANSCVVDSLKNLIEGMAIDFLDASNNVIASSCRIIYIDRVNNTVKFISQTPFTPLANQRICVQGSFGNELTGLGAIFNSGVDKIYGVSKAEHAWLKPYIKDLSSAGTPSDISEMDIQNAIDRLEEVNGSVVDFIVCSSGVRRNYQELMSTYKRNIDVMTLDGGFKAITYNGIPLVSDRFAGTGEMYLLNSKEFKLHQLCDWKWLENENGRILRQNAGKPTYSATLVKYAELICDKPCGQAKLSGIKES